MRIVRKNQNCKFPTTKVELHWVGDKMKKQVLKENLSIEIAAIKTTITKLRKDILAASSDVIRIAIEEELARQEQNYAELIEELDEVKNAQRRSATNELQNIILASKQSKPEYHLAYIATDNKYTVIKNYSTTEDRVNLTTQNLTDKPMIGVLNNLIGKPGYFSQLTADELRTAFETAGASYMIQTASFDKPKWDPVYVFNILEIQRKYWAPIDTGSTYNELFDDLVYSLAGGKKENIEHIERWVSYKYLYPDKNRITPGLNITGKPGGNGKGLFAAILTSIFTPLGVTFVKSKQLAGGFNAILEGKVIAIMDDERKDRFPQDELKQNTGNNSLLVEPKGINAYSVDSTGNFVVLDNDGGVKLVGGGSAGEDRRWSIISTELTLLETLAEKYDLTPDQSKQLAEQMGELFSNRIECGRWVAGLIERHNMRNVFVLMPLHGEDYQARLNEQKDNWIGIFEQVLPILVNQGVIPFKFIKEIIEAETGEKIKKQQTLSNKFDEFLSRCGFKNVEKIDMNVHIVFGVANCDKFKGRVRRIDPGADVFDYSLVSTRPYNRKEIITKETLQLRDFTEETPEFAETQIKVAKVARSLTDKKPNDYAGLSGDEKATLNSQGPLRSLKSTENSTMGPLLKQFFESRK